MARTSARSFLYTLLCSGVITIVLGAAMLSGAGRGGRRCRRARRRRGGDGADQAGGADVNARAGRRHDGAPLGGDERRQAARHAAARGRRQHPRDHAHQPLHAVDAGGAPGSWPRWWRRSWRAAPIGDATTANGTTVLMFAAASGDVASVEAIAKRKRGPERAGGGARAHRGDVCRGRESCGGGDGAGQGRRGSRRDLGPAGSEGRRSQQVQGRAVRQPRAAEGARRRSRFGGGRRRAERRQRRRAEQQRLRGSGGLHPRAGRGPGLLRQRAGEHARRPHAASLCRAPGLYRDGHGAPRRGRGRQPGEDRRRHHAADAGHHQRPLRPGETAPGPRRGPEPRGHQWHHAALRDASTSSGRRAPAAPSCGRTRTRSCRTWT